MGEEQGERKRIEHRPNEAESIFLRLAYNSFYDLFDEVMDDSFWSKDSGYRFSHVTNGFAIYSELLNYEPIQWVINHMKAARPPMEAEIGSDLFRFVRNVIAHFPFSQKWDDIWISKTIVNWHKNSQFIDRYLSSHAGKAPVKYRFWEESKKKMTYLSINFPSKYEGDIQIFLKDMIDEINGVKFCFILMKQIMDTQVERNP